MGLSQVPHPAAEGRGAEIVQPGRAVGLRGVWREGERLGAVGRVVDRVRVFRDEAVRGDEFAPVDGSNRQFRDGIFDRAIPAAGHEIMATPAGRHDGHEQRDLDRVDIGVFHRQGAESAAERMVNRQPRPSIELGGPLYVVRWFEKLPQSVGEIGLLICKTQGDAIVERNLFGTSHASSRTSGQSTILERGTHTTAAMQPQ